MKLFLLFHTLLCSNFAIQISRFSQECFYETLQHGDRLEISFEVLSSSKGEFVIDFTILNPDGSLLHNVDAHRDAAFGFYAGSTGQHKMCFLNKNSGADKVVSFTFLGPDDQSKVQAPVDATEAESTLAHDLQELSNDVRFLKDELGYLNRRITRHSQTKSTHGRVFWWTTFQMLLLIAVVYFQVSYLQKFFDKRRLI